MVWEIDNKDSLEARRLQKAVCFLENREIAIFQKVSWPPAENRNDEADFFFSVSTSPTDKRILPSAPSVSCESMAKNLFST